MKFTAFFVIFFIYTPLVLADTNKCNDMKGIHCIYFTEDQSSKNGRYVKSTLASNGRYNINCTRDGFSDVIPQQAGKGWGKGKRAISYEQCLNAKCKSSKSLGTDTFTIIKNGQGYISHPRYFRVRLLSNYGASCTARTPA